MRRISPRRTPAAVAVMLAGLLCAVAPGRAGTADELRDGCRSLLGGRFQAAAQAFHEAMQEDVQCAEALAGEGASYLLNGQQDAAASCFERALALDDRQPAAQVGSGTLSLLQRDYAAAVDHYRAALAEDTPHAAAIRASEAQAACLAGLFEVAETEARTALQEQPGHELALQVLAAALLARNHSAEALQVLSAPIEQGVQQTLGIVADSPLYSPLARYYADHRLDDALRLAVVGAPAPPPPLIGTPAPTAPTVFSRGDASFHIEWPKPGGAVSGRLDVSVYAAADLAVQYVAVLIDEQFAGMSNATPFHIYVDSSLARDGLREIRVDGYGADGTIVKSASALVNISNGQRTLSPDERALRQGVTDFLEGLLVLRAHPLLRAQLVGHALEAEGKLQQALDAYEYAFSYDCTLPCIHADLLLCYRKLGLLDAVAMHEIHNLAQPNAVALTFDDGPHPILTPWILDLLDRYHAKATFLLVGKQVELYPELVREIIKRGHEIGSHSYTHSNMRQLSTLGVERELVMSRQVIRRASGEFVTLFRPPGGNYDPQVRQAVELTGFTTVFWNENITSYPGATGPEILPKMLGKLSDGGIVLLHNGFDETREVLPLLLPALAQRHLKMDTISALTAHRPFRVQHLLTQPLEWRL
ncbi:MAG: polysaccharide deacetylase family protein [Armatimonadetes bacterium]|nr:polysaccharide deacetylase family protein [Armatimonadota bacterium]